MKYLKLEYKYEIALTELDFELRDQYFGEGSEEDVETIIEGTECLDWSEEATPISIDSLKSVLLDLEEKECTHVEIVQHSDHYGYYITGLRIREATPREIGEKLATIDALDLKARQQQIERLEKQLKYLKELKDEQI